jgi:PEP-CTERM motif
MKKTLSLIAFTLASASTLPASITITANILVPNGKASGGNGTATNDLLQILSPPGTITASTSGVAPNNVVTLPVTTYSVSGIDLTSLGGTASESFTFTVTYTATTDGVTSASPAFTAFGNAGSGADGVVSGTETLTATVALASTSFSQLSLSGFILARAGGLSGAETGTFTWTGGSEGVLVGDTITTAVTGNSFTLTAGAATSLNLEGFQAQFVAVPEPASASLLALGAVALLRRRRTA